MLRLVSALLLKHNDEWAVRARYMALESVARLSDDPLISLPAVARCADQPAWPENAVRRRQLHHAPGHDRRQFRLSITRSISAQSLTASYLCGTSAGY